MKMLRFSYPLNDDTMAPRGQANLPVTVAGRPACSIKGTSRWPCTRAVNGLPGTWLSLVPVVVDQWVRVNECLINGLTNGGWLMLDGS